MLRDWRFKARSKQLPIPCCPQLPGNRLPGIQNFPIPAQDIDAAPLARAGSAHIVSSVNDINNQKTAVAPANSKAEAAGLLAGAGAPPAGRRYIGFSPIRHTLVERAERAVAWLPIGAQYCVWGVKRN